MPIDMTSGTMTEQPQENKPMTSIRTRIARAPRPAHDRQRPKRGDSGLTTLEWLLIVAAVAGLAALAVVLVTSVVSDTSEQISGASARKTSAQLAGAEITNRARAETAIAGTAANAANEVGELNDSYRNRCLQLRSTYGDITGLMVNWGYGNPNATPITFTSGDVLFTPDNAAAATAWNAAATGPFCRVT